MQGVPHVTVVIATRNRRALLAEAVASVRRQAGVAWQLVVVDDGSSDDSAGFLSTLPKVEVVRLAHGERSRARNQGLAVARAGQIMFLDDDDVLHEDALRRLSAALDRYPEAVAAVGARQDWFVGEDYRRRDIHPLREQVRPMFDELLFGWSAVSGQNLFRTHLVRAVGGYDESIRQVEDRDLWLRVARLGPVALCPATVMTYRIPAERQLPVDIRQQREWVARRAIRALPRVARRRALCLRRCTALIDGAEDDVRAGRPWSSGCKLIRAIGLAPRLMLSPLIATWIGRRMLGRVYHRYWKR